MFDFVDFHSLITWTLKPSYIFLDLSISNIREEK